MDAQPIRLALSGEDRLLIEWSDGQKREYTFKQLRDACPCATCREKRSQPPAEAPAKTAGGFVGLPVLSAAEARPLKIVEMKPVGNYAYAIGFSDGHSSGIYTLEFLRELGRKV